MNWIIGAACIGFIGVVFFLVINMYEVFAALSRLF